jgi:hypothetical protein
MEKALEEAAGATPARSVVEGLALQFSYALLTSLDKCSWQMHRRACFDVLYGDSRSCLIGLVLCRNVACLTGSLSLYIRC